ncbi:MAG TPA: hypothetical protein VGV93_00165 [Acidimicrobiales bacterium]|nr:hypothetical protein [Acidimicrobiales bacterium]
MSYCFRIRFTMGLTVCLNLDVRESVLHRGGAVVVTLKAADSDSIAQARRLAVSGSGYTSAEAATAEGGRWLSALQAAFARIHVGADFGLREPRASLGEEELRWAEERFGVERALHDEPGVVVYQCDPSPKFLSSAAQVVVGKPPAKVAAAIGDALAHKPTLTDQQALAYDLFSASFFQPSADARFMMLMMGLETLIEEQPRSNDVVDHVNSLIERTRAADLPAVEISSLVGSLERLRSESISQAGQRLVAALAGRSYMDESPGTFFKRCYEVRSRLVHGSVPRPSWDDVNLRAPNLELLVGDLISYLVQQQVGEPQLASPGKS